MRTKTNWRPIYPEEAWYCIDVDKYAMVSKTLPQDDDIQREEGAAMLCQYFYNPADLDRVVEEVLQEQKTISLHFFWELKYVMQVLATPEGQIKEPSGLYDPIPDKPRQFADVRNGIANQLSGLTNFTARVKMDATLPQNPGKKCLSCGNQNISGAIYCVGCGTKITAVNEYTITTLAPGQGIGKIAFDQRIAAIQARNRDPQYGGYCRPRKDVEAEIIQRQTSISGSAPAQPQVPQQQPRHARQVPVQGNCPNCGKSNPPGSQFCNQCGAQL